jgi:hypothetical protein
MHRAAAIVFVTSALVLPAVGRSQSGTSPGGAPMMTLGPVLLFNAPALAPDADTEAFERRVLGLAPARPGWNIHLLRADRGSRKGQYLVVSTALQRDTAKSAGLPSPDLPALVGSGGGQAEYHLLSPEKAGALPAVDVLGIHSTKVRPEKREAFERFIGEKVHPAVANLRPDLRILYYRAVQGGGASNYIAVIALTRASRDKYWPGGSDSDELRAAFKPVQGLTQELITYLVEGSYLADPKFAAAVYESREWSDFVLMQRGR